MNNKEDARQLYDEISIFYKHLPNEQKNIIYKDAMDLFEKLNNLNKIVLGSSKTYQVKPLQLANGIVVKTRRAVKC